MEKHVDSNEEQSSLDDLPSFDEEWAFDHCEEPNWVGTGSTYLADPVKVPVAPLSPASEHNRQHLEACEFLKQFD